MRSRKPRLSSSFELLILSADGDAGRNLRPQSREISLEEEKSEVLAEMRKISESSNE